MKKIITTLTILLLAGLVVSAQNPFLKDQSNVYLKVETDKVGIGMTPTADKISVASVAGETILGLKGYPNHYNPYISLYNSNSVAIWKLFANAEWFTIGLSRDTTRALLVGRPDDGWLKVNGTIAATKMQATTGAFTTVAGHSAAITHLEVADSTGIILTNASGTKYRIFITPSGGIGVITVTP